MENQFPRELTFSMLRQAALLRLPAFQHGSLEEWSPGDWATAMAGECGEACNLIKKLRRGENISKEDIAKELADVVAYTDLLAARLGIDLGAAVRDKFNEVSLRVNSPIRL